MIGEIDHQAHFLHKLKTLKELKIELPKDPYILDYCCGAGGTVYGISDLGFKNVYGFDILDHVKLRSTESKKFFSINPDGKIPFQDNTFDLIMSDQVFEHVQNQEYAFREIFRVLKPGGYAFHIIPAKHQIIEPHIYVPLGGLINAKWYYKFWALLGIRNEFQKGLSAEEVAKRNKLYEKNGLNYVENSVYRKMWKRIGYKFKYVEPEYINTNLTSRNRKLKKLASIFPFIWTLIRTFWVRIVIMEKN